jgi:uncharacterized CHY-type Zn-finger protein
MENAIHLIRITVKPDPGDPRVDFHYARRLRRDLWAHTDSDIDPDPDSDRNRTRLDASRRAFFEFATEEVGEIDRALKELGHENRVIVENRGPATFNRCVQCGFDSGSHDVAVCPQCHFRDIEPCPVCKQEIGRQTYRSVEGDVFECPNCGSRVRFSFNEPLLKKDGAYNEPLVLVEPLGQPAETAVS